MVRPRAGLRWRLVATGAAAALVASVLTLTWVAAPQGVQPASGVAPSVASPLPVEAAPVAGGAARPAPPPPDDPSARHDAPPPNDSAARRDAPAPGDHLARPVSPAAPPRGAAGPLPPARKGELVIVVRPWAMIWLNGRELGQTPFRDAVAAGKYSLRIANDNLGIDETTTITVMPDRSTKVERSW
jgi:serine/threonine-protein kinase